MVDSQTQRKLLIDGLQKRLAHRQFYMIRIRVDIEGIKQWLNDTTKRKATTECDRPIAWIKRKSLAGV